MPGHLLDWPAYGTNNQRGGWPSVAKLTWDQRGGAGHWGMVPNGGAQEVSRWHQTSCQQRRRCPQLKSLRCSSTMFTRVHGLSYRGKNRRAAGIESHRLLLGNDVLPETWAKNRESTSPIPVKKDVTEILSNSRNRNTTGCDALRYKERIRIRQYDCIIFIFYNLKWNKYLLILPKLNNQPHQIIRQRSPELFIIHAQFSI